MQPCSGTAALDQQQFPPLFWRQKSSSRNKIVVDLAGSARPHERRRDEERHKVSPRLRRVEQGTIALVSALMRHKSTKEYRQLWCVFEATRYDDLRNRVWTG